MISKVKLKFSSYLAQANEIKNHVLKVSKLKKTKAAVIISGITCYYYYLYKSDNDYLVDEFPKTLPVTMYRVLPFTWLSRIFGRLSEVEIPLSGRELILGSFADSIGCDLSEAKHTDIRDYKSISDIFQRQLKWDSRPVDRISDMTSPCDGTVLYLGKAYNNTIEQVKGVKFTVNGFLGKDYTFNEMTATIQKENPKNELFYCTIYLAPGDYHRFHSPTECELSYRRYFNGKLMSVNPKLAKWIPGIFSVNERAVYFGKWKYGLFTFTAVGATNVGNISVYCDQSLPLNKDYQKLDLVGRRKEGTALKIRPNGPVTWEKELMPPIKMSRGQLLGKFNLGSTIVLIFEAPQNFQFHVEKGDKVKMGESLGSVRTNVRP